LITVAVPCGWGKRVSIFLHKLILSEFNSSAHFHSAGKDSLALRFFSLHLDLSLQDIVDPSLLQLSSSRLTFPEHHRTSRLIPCYFSGELESAKKKAKLAHPRQPAAIVLDIEGTIAPISFVTDTLFPYAQQHLEGHLQKTFALEETQTDIKMLQAEVHSLFCSNCHSSMHYLSFFAAPISCL
jgi:hypothetical protein